jgi:hypothetical protein
VLVATVCWLPVVSPQRPRQGEAAPGTQDAMHGDERAQSPPTSTAFPPELTPRPAAVVDDDTARALSRQQRGDGIQPAPCWSQRRRGSCRVLPWSRAVASPSRPSRSPGRRRRRLGPAHGAGVPDLRPLVARPRRRGAAVRRRPGRPLAPGRPRRARARPRVLPAHPVVDGRLRRQPAVGGPGRAGVALPRRHVPAHLGRPAPAAEHPLASAGPRRRPARVGAAGVGAGDHAVRRVPVGAARVQPGRRPTGAVRAVCRGARPDLRRRLCGRAAAPARA